MARRRGGGHRRHLITLYPEAGIKKKEGTWSWAVLISSREARPPEVSNRAPPSDQVLKQRHLQQTFHPETLSFVQNGKNDLA